MPLWTQWLGLIRGPFLLLTPSCMVLGLVAALIATPSGHGRDELWWLGALAFLGGLAAHVSVNALNEWSDFKSGLDQQTKRTPFSGGSGTLPANPALAPLAWWTGVLALVLTCVIGVFFLWRWSSAWWLFLPLGLSGVMLVLAYTTWVTRHPWLCLVAPGAGVGLLMVAGTEFALIGHYTAPVWWLAMVPFCLGNNLLLLNQFPDVMADRAVGRLTLPILWGRQRCVTVLQVQWGACYGLLALAVAWGVLPWPALSGLLTVPLAWRVGQLARRHADDPGQLLPAMGLNVALTLVTPWLISMGLMVGWW